MALGLQDPEEYDRTIYANEEPTPDFEQVGWQEDGGSGTPHQMNSTALQSMAVVTSTEKLGSVKLVFELKGSRVEQEFFRRPLGFEISAERKTKMFSCSAGMPTGKFIVTKVADSRLKKILKKGMQIVKINDIDVPQDIEDFEFVEMFSLALSLLPEISEAELKLQAERHVEASAEEQMAV
eukprot:TRINITY_DN2103_c0_g1_i11.p1 TRINITY_DN2103_c0_g1~~TRINITY_DN2103_c0_g1_i11.p1  ORF type:complete len:201 (+),score=44.84 TRINITY_DN2103_c0_g1_i11:62-604(+)